MEQIAKAKLVSNSGANYLETVFLYNSHFEMGNNTSTNMRHQTHSGSSKNYQKTMNCV